MVSSRRIVRSFARVCQKHGHEVCENDLHHRCHRIGRQPRGRRSPEARPSRPGAGATHERHPLARPVGRADRRRRPGRRPLLEAGATGADWVFNCAAKVGDWGTLEEFRRLNVEALRLLLEAASRARVERFVHVSSLGVYEGRDHYGTDETVPPAANSLDAYTRSKTEAEALRLEYQREARTARRRSSARVSSTASATAPSCPSCSTASSAACSPTSAQESKCSTVSMSRTWSKGSSWPRKAPRPSVKCST